MSRKPELSGLPALPYLPVDPGKEPTLTLRQGVQGIFRGRLLIAATSLVGLLIGTWMALSQPNVYRSVARFIISSTGHENVTPNLIRASAEGAQRSTVNLRGNAVEMLQDDALHRRIVDRVGARTILKPFAPMADPGDSSLLGSVRDAVYAVQRWLSGASEPVSEDMGLALKVFRANFRAEERPQTDFIELSYLANDPELARQVVQAAVTEALARHVETYSHTKLIDLARADRDKALADYTEASHALEEFKRENTIENFTLQMTQTEMRASANDLEASNLASRIELAEKRIIDFGERIAALPELVEEKTVEQIENANIPIMRGSIEELRREKFRLERTVKKDDAQLVAIDDQIRNLERQVEEEEKKPRQTRDRVSHVPNSDRQNLIRAREETKIQIEDDSARLVNYRADRDRARKELQRLSQLGPVYRQLEQAEVASRENLRFIERSLADSEKRLELTLSGISSLKVSQEPTTPLDRDGPKRTRIVLGGLLGGLFVGVALLLLRAITDPTVRGPEDLERALGIRTLASIPDLGAVHVRRHQRQRVTSWN
jgi:uncharacterized protein involved in exopolysaccharide biosynthesis